MVPPMKGFMKVLLVFHIGVAAAAFTGISSRPEIYQPVLVTHVILGFVTLFYLVDLNKSKP